MTTYKQARGATTPGTNDGSWKTMERDDARLNGTLEEFEHTDEASGVVEDLTDAWLRDNDPDRADLRKPDIDWDAVLSHAHSLGNSLAHAKGVSNRSNGAIDGDDISSMAILGLVEAIENGREVKDPKAYLATTARIQAMKAASGAMANGKMRQNSDANKEFKKQAAELEATVGRSLTPTEQDALAEKIFNSWDERRKPDRNFRQYAGQMEFSISAYESDEQAEALLNSSARRGQAPEQGSNDILPGSFTDRVLDASEGHSGTRRDVKFLAWNALAEHSDSVPSVKGGTLSQRKVSAVKATIENYPGGVMGAVQAWEDGKSDEGTEALFAPWGEDADARDAVCDQMQRFPERADLLWESALMLGNNRYAERV